MGRSKSRAEHAEQGDGGACQDHQGHGDDLGEEDLEGGQRGDHQLLDGAPLLFAHHCRGRQQDGEQGDHRQQLGDAHEPGVVLVGVVPDAGIGLDDRAADPAAAQAFTQGGHLQAVAADDLGAVAGGQEAEHRVGGVHLQLHGHLFAPGQTLAKARRNVEHGHHVAVIQVADGLLRSAGAARGLEVRRLEAAGQLTGGQAVVTVEGGDGSILELHADPGGGDVDVAGEGIEEEHHQGHIAKELEQLLVGHHAQATQAGAGEEGVHDDGLLLNSR
jgi:hypothetical protein